MTAYEVPTSALDQTFSVALGGITYQLTTRWCAPASAWVLDIADVNGVALVSGIPIVTGVDLLEQYRHLGIAGQLVAQTDGDTFAVPTQANLGTAGRLYFVTTDGATSTPAPEVVTTTPSFTRGVQGFSPNLEALSSLTVIADTVPYYTGGVTAALTAFPAAGRTLVGALSTIDQQTVLGLVIGANTQAYSIELDALSALTSTGFVQRTGYATYSASIPPGALLGIIEDQKASGTNGGTFTSGAWQTRDLNTVVYDRLLILSTFTNQFTISVPGTYEISWSALSYNCAWNQSRLYNVSDSSVVEYGTPLYFNSNLIGPSTGITIVTIAAPKTFEIQHQCSSTQATNGFGVAASMGLEIYTTVVIRQG
jgi:hypothetical protein